jgi:zinc transport system substrate-binding protein
VRSQYSFSLFSLLAAFLSACGEAPLPVGQQDAGRPYVVAVNYPLQYFAMRLAGNKVDVRLLAPADTDPAEWQPTVEDVLQLQGAQLVLLNGAAYSAWLDKVAISSNRLVVTSERASEQWIELQGQVTHSHGPGGEHAHGGFAFTTWMDMSLARLQAESVAAALIDRWPDDANAVARNLEVLLADIDALDADYYEQSERLSGRQFVYSHPVYQYFERRYDLQGTSLHWEPDEMPGDEQWRELQRILADDTVFVWEAEPNADVAAAMHKNSINFVVVTPAANRAEADWLTIQRANIERLSEVQ